MATVRSVIVGSGFKPGGVAALGGLTTGSKIELKAEPENPHDPFAVACWFGGTHCGYLPRHSNREVASVLGGGHQVSATVTEIATIVGGKVKGPPHIEISWGQ